MENRKHEIEIDLPASPDEVWQAITDAEKISQWFAPVVRVTPGVGGSIFLSWGGGMEGEAPIRVWEPGKQFGWVEGEGTGKPRIIDFHLAAKEGGTTTLRLVHSGFGASSNFDEEYESVFGGWHTFFAMLRYGLGRWSGVKALNVCAVGMAAESKAASWERLCKDMQFSSTREGDAYTAVLGPFILEGTVLRNPKTGYLCLSVKSLEDSLLGIFVEGGKKAIITLEWILYGDSVPQHEAPVRDAIGAFVRSQCEPPA